MRNPESFAVPRAIFAERMPAKTRDLLVFLFSVSMSGGECSPGWLAIENATGQSDDTARVRLQWLKKRGWISHTRRRQAGPMLIYVRVPARLRPDAACIKAAAAFKVVK